MNEYVTASESRTVTAHGIFNNIYEKLIKGYTEKQWGRPCNELPSFIIKRLPVRLTYDNNYFNALYQGIPNGGYTQIIEKMLEGIDVELGTDYIAQRNYYNSIAEKVIYSGAIDEFYDYKYGMLQYRTVNFETEILDIDNYQGNAVVNYTDSETPWTRIIEHKWFEFGKDKNGYNIPKTIISKEYSTEWDVTKESYYPINDERNAEIYMKYRGEAENENNVCFGGRLGEYKYYDMDVIVKNALKLSIDL